MPPAPFPHDGSSPGPEPVSRAWTWAAAVFAVVVTFGVIAKFHPEIQRMRALEARVLTLAREEAEWEQRLAARAKEHRHLADSRGYREAVARDVLDLRRPGETIYRPAPTP